MENKLFNKELIEQYLNQPSTKGNTLEQKLKNKRIYTLEELEPILSSTGYFTRNREENTSIDLITGDNKAKFLRILYYNICRKEIGGRYLERSLEKSAYDPNFEIVVLFDNQFEETELPETADNYESQNTFQSDFTDSQYSQSQNETQLTDFGDSNLEVGTKRTIMDTEYDSTDSNEEPYRPRKRYVPGEDKRYDVDNVVAFLIAQKGECKKYPEIYCVNLICSRSGERGAGSGQVLMGLFLYSIKENPVVTSKVGLLELATGYLNVSGLASYSKLGFKASYGLYGEYCFSDYNNLPMSITIIEPQKIIDILVDGATFYEKPALCSFSGQPDLQKFLGFLKNLYIFSTLVPAVKRDDYIVDDEYRYRYFYEELMKIGRSGRRLKTMIENLESGKNTMADYKQTSVLFQEFKSGNVGGRTRKNRKTRSKKTRSKKTRTKKTRTKKTRSKKTRKSKR